MPTSVDADRERLGYLREADGLHRRQPFGYTALYGYVQKKGWANFEKIGKRLRAQTGVAGQQSARLAGRRCGGLPDVADGSAQRSRTARSSRTSSTGRTTRTRRRSSRAGWAITAKAASPASAKLFLDFDLLEGRPAGDVRRRLHRIPQRLHADEGCTNTLADVYAKVGAKNIDPGAVQPEVRQRPPEVHEALARDLRLAHRI